MSSAGLLFDIVGAWFVAWEVVNQFEGKRTVLYRETTVKEGITYSTGPHTDDSDEYKIWESTKHWKMKLGLGKL